MAPSTLTVQRFVLKRRKTDNLLENILRFYISANGEKMLYRIAGAPQSGATPAPPQSWAIAPVPPEPTPGATPAATAGAPQGAKALNLATMEVRVDPPAEWRQMYHEAFRLERDFFYDPGFHGLDLKTTEKNTSPTWWEWHRVTI